MWLILFLYMTNFFYFAAHCTICLLASIQAEKSSILKYDVNYLFLGRLRQEIIVSNPISFKIVGGQLYVPLVTNETALRYVVVQNISSSIGRPTIFKDEYENVYACWKDITIESKGKTSFEIDYDVLSFDTNFLINSSLVKGYDPNSDVYDEYVQPEELIQSDNPEIISTAQGVTNDMIDLHEKVFKIYDYVVGHVQYTRESSEKGALWALENRTGDCSEYSYLFVALCRAASIPAKIQTGFAFRSDDETLEDGHMWAEYYLENYGWIPVDATWKDFDSLDHRHFNSLQSIPEPIPYSNIFFKYTNGPEEQYLQEEQNVTLTSCSSNAFNSSVMKDVKTTIAKIQQAKISLTFVKLCGTSTLFPSTVKEAEQELSESRIQLQNAIESWQASPQNTQTYALDAMENAEKVLQIIWTLALYAFATIVGAIAVVTLIIVIVLKKRNERLSKKT